MGEEEEEERRKGRGSGRTSICTDRKKPVLGIRLIGSWHGLGLENDCGS